MCAVASRGLYQGWGLAELSEHGIGFSLFETPALARVAADVAREETDRRPAAIPIPVGWPTDGSATGRMTRPLSIRQGSFNSGLPAPGGRPGRALGAR